MAANPQPPYSCSYFSQVYKKKDRADRSMRAGHIAPEFTPDFYLGSNGFRAWNVPPDTNNVIKVRWGRKETNIVVMLSPR